MKTNYTLKGIDLELPRYILEHLVPDANEKSISSAVLVKRILAEHYKCSPPAINNPPV